MRSTFLPARNYLGIWSWEEYSPTADRIGGRPLSFRRRTPWRLITPICQRAEAEPQDGLAATYCGALLLCKAFATGDKSQSKEILRRPAEAVQLSPKDPLANCQLGRALEWIGQWKEARSQMETCVRLQPDSAENHYRLAQVYQHLGLPELARQQFQLHDAARRKMIEDIAHRDATIKHFLYDLQNGAKP